VFSRPCISFRYNDTTLCQAGAVLKVKPGVADRELARRLEGGSEVVWGGTLPEEVFTEYGGVTLADTSSGVCEFAGFYIDLVCIDRDPALRRLFENVRVTFWIDNKEVMQILPTFRLGGLYSRWNIQSPEAAVGVWGVRAVGSVELFGRVPVHSDR
jgi:hypothetical protein